MFIRKRIPILGGLIVFCLHLTGCEGFWQGFFESMTDHIHITNWYDVNETSSDYVNISGYVEFGTDPLATSVITASISCDGSEIDTQTIFDHDTMEFSFDVSLGEGNHEYTVMAYEDGWYACEKSITIGCDTTAPSVYGFSPAAGSTIPANNFVLSGSVSDSNEVTSISVTGPGTLSGLARPTSSTWNISITGVPAGIQTYSYSATDSFGNTRNGSVSYNFVY